MEDHVIVEMYWRRNPEAIRETAKAYGPYCKTIARNILHDARDAEECVNDTWLGTWNAIPENRPTLLAPFLGKITRNLAFNRYKSARAEKRGGGVPPPMTLCRRWRQQSWGRRSAVFCIHCRSGTAMYFCAGTGLVSLWQRSRAGMGCGRTP